MYTIDNSTYPALIEGHGMQLYYIPYTYQTLYGPEQWWHDMDQEALYVFVNRYWSVTIWIAIAYVVGIHALKRYMEHRRAFDLKWPLIVWNASLAIFSLVGTIRASEEIFYVFRTYPLLDSISYSGDPFQPGYFWGFCFCLSKFAELFDTVFIVLRKKPLIFLHWYHHAIVLVAVWHGGKEGVAGGRWFGSMNYFVHTLMYSYFALSAAGLRFPKVVSMILTTLQTTQMFVGVAITFIVFYYKQQGRIMQHSYENLYLCFAIYVSFAYLFSDFFSKSYVKEKIAKKEV